MSRRLAWAGLDALLRLYQTISIQGATVNDFGFLETHRNNVNNAPGAWNG